MFSTMAAYTTYIPDCIIHTTERHFTKCIIIPLGGRPYHNRGGGVWKRGPVMMAIPFAFVVVERTRPA